MRFVGDPVAIVVAETRELARDAAELVEVEYEPLDVDRRRAPRARRDAPVLHPDAGTNLVWEGVYEWGSWQDAVAEADRIVKISELHFDRFNSTPLECDGALVEYNRGTGQWTIHCNNQFPGFAAIMMGPAIRCGIDKLRFVTQDIGGGFGNKITSHPQLVACCLLARKLNRAIQWTEWRTEFHLSMSHGNERWFHDTEVAVKDDGTLLGFRTKALDDAGAFTRYEPLGGVIWAQVTPGMYRWRNIRLEFTQVVTNKAPCSPNRGYSRMQHLWFTERVIDIVAHELGLDPVEMRKRNYIRADEMPYKTPNGCVYDSGDYARMLDLALELVGGRIAERRREAEARGQLLGLGIGSTLDSGTNNFGQSRLINPELQFSGNNEVATVKLDIFGEIVVTLGTTPQGQGHETAASQVVADILGCGRRRGDRARRPRLVLELARRLLGDVREPVRRHRPQRREGRDRGARASTSAGSPRACSAADGPDDIVLERRLREASDNPEAALPFFAVGAIINANNAAIPEELATSRSTSATSTCRRSSCPTSSASTATSRSPTRRRCTSPSSRSTPRRASTSSSTTRPSTTAARGSTRRSSRARSWAPPRTAIGAATHETFTYDDEGNLLTPNFYDYHVPHAMDVPPLKTAAIESPSPFTPLGTKGMGEGGGAAIHAICAALQDALKAAGAPIVYDSCNPPARVWELIQDPAASRARVEVVPA